MSQEVMNELVNMSQEIIKLKDQNRDLLGALKWAMARIEKKAPHQAIEGDGELYAFAAAIAAIAKAEGEKA